MENRRDDESETPIQIVNVYEDIDDINNYEYSQVLENNFEYYDNERYDAFNRRRRSRTHMDVFRNLKIYVEEMIDYVSKQMSKSFKELYATNKSRLLSVYRTRPHFLQYYTQMANDGSPESREVLDLMHTYLSLIDNYIPSNHDSAFGRRLWY